MLVVGLSGGVATGKSTVTSLLKQHGLNVLDCDEIAHNVTRRVGSATVTTTCAMCKSL